MTRRILIRVLAPLFDALWEDHWRRMRARYRDAEYAPLFDAGAAFDESMQRLRERRTSDLRELGLLED